MRKAILEQFPEKETFNRYIEVFGGAGWVLFASDKHADMEVYNDVNGNLVNLFRIVKYHPEALQKELDWILMSREQFFDATQKVRGLTDIQRAARFFIAIKESYGADCRSFGIKNINMHSAVKFLEEASERLKKVIVENVDFEHLLRTYNRVDSLFYLDPPYYDAEKYYPDRFQPEDHIRLRDALRQLKGKFLLSYNDCSEIRKMYADFTIIEVCRNDSLVAKKETRQYRELIIKNY